MQASVHTYDQATGAGSVLLDTGKVVPFEAEAMAGSGLRLLRLGQRVSIEIDGDPEAAPDGATLTRLWLTGIGPDRPAR